MSHWIRGAFATLMIAGFAVQIYAQTEHVHPKGNPPSEYTIKVLEQAQAKLPFTDKRDFEENSKGFIAAPDSMKIMADAGHTAWDMERYQFLASGEEFASIHPSLQRQSTLNLAFGLTEAVAIRYLASGTWHLVPGIPYIGGRDPTEENMEERHDTFRDNRRRPGVCP